MFRPERLPLVARRQFLLTAAAAGGGAILGDHIDLRDFTPRGDGSADDGPAIQRAIEQAAGRAIWVPPGRYLVETPIRYVGQVNRHAPGLQLIGAGQGNTIFDCRVAGGPALFIDQAAPYFFTKNGRIEGIRFAGQPGTPGQEGIRVSGAWDYRLANVQIDGFSSHGISAPWRDDLTWPMEGIETEKGSPIIHSRGGFITSGAVYSATHVSGPRIPKGTSISRIVDDKTIILSQPATETGGGTLRFVGNSDAFQSILHIEDTSIVRNGGWGIWGRAAVGLICRMWNIDVGLNKGGGIYCGGNAWRIVGGSITDNGADGGCGFMAERITGPPEILHIEAIEFDGNYNANLWLRACSAATVYHCRFISHYQPAENAIRAPVGVVIGDPAGEALRIARDISIDECVFRAQYSYTHAYTGIRLGAPESYSNIDILDPYWLTLSAGHHKIEGNPATGSFVHMRKTAAPPSRSDAPRALGVLEKTVDQKLARGRAIQIAFERVRIQSRHAATPGIVRRVPMVQGEATIPAEAANLTGLRSRSDRRGQAKACDLEPRDERRWRPSHPRAPATATRAADVLIGGAMAPYAGDLPSRCDHRVTGAPSRRCRDVGLDSR